MCCVIPNSTVVPFAIIFVLSTKDIFACLNAICYNTYLVYVVVAWSFSMILCITFTLRFSDYFFILFLFVCRWKYIFPTLPNLGICYRTLCNCLLCFDFIFLFFSFLFCSHLFLLKPFL